MTQLSLIILYTNLLWFVLVPSALSTIFVKNIAKIFIKSSLFGEKTITAFRNVSFELQSKEILCVLGSSGSGKSTLVKCIGSVDSMTASYGEVLTDDNKQILSCYLGLQYKERYQNNNHLCNQYFNHTFMSNIPPVKQAYTLLDMPSISACRIGSLLESQRIVFNIFLEIQNKYVVNYSDSHKSVDKSSIPTTQNDVCGDNNSNDEKASIIMIIILDEYLDKIASSVRISIFKKILILLSADSNSTEGNNDESNIYGVNVPTYEWMGVVVTHSSGVLRDCKTRTAIMNNGRLYDIKSDYKKLMRPAQLQLID